MHTPGRHPRGVDAHGVAAAGSRRARARRGRPRAARSAARRPATRRAAPARAARSRCLPCAGPRRARGAATAGQSARSELRSATSRLARIDASGLRSSCDASDTNCRCRCDDCSSRSSIAFIVCASRPTSSSVPGSGTRRWMVEPVIDAAWSRIASTGRSARPAKYHTANATRSTRSGTAIHIRVVTLSTVALTSSSDCSATSVMLPAVGLDLALAPRCRRVVAARAEQCRSELAVGIREAAARWTVSRRSVGCRSPLRSPACRSSSCCWLVSSIRSTRLLCTTRTSPNAAALNAIANTSAADEREPPTHGAGPDDGTGGAAQSASTGSISPSSASLTAPAPTGSRRRARSGSSRRSNGWSIFLRR